MAHRVRQLALVEPPVSTINLATNPSMEAAAAAVVVRTNFFGNPRAVANALTFWNRYAAAGGVGTGLYSTGQSGWANGVTTSYRQTWTTGSTVIAGGLYLGKTVLPIDATTIPVTPGRVYAMAAEVRCSKAQRMRLQILWYDAAATALAGAVTSPEFVLQANTAAPCGIVGTAPATAAFMAVTIYSTAGASSSLWLAGDWLEATNGHIEETDQPLAITGGSAITGTFSGATAAATYGADFSYAWSGAVNASSSQQKAPSVAGYQVPTYGVAHQSSDQASSGSKSLRYVAGTGVWSDNYVQWVAPTVVGKVYTFTAKVWIPAGSVGWKARIGGVADGTRTTLTGQWVLLSITWTATAATSRPLIAPADVSTVRGNDVVLIDDWQVEEGSAATDYFSGSTPDVEGTDYSWTGAADASTSQRVVSATWVDLSCEAYDVTIRRGRGDPDEQPEAGTATLDLYSAVPAGLDVGSKLQVQTQASNAAWLTRFTGYVADVGLEYAMAVDPDTLQLVVQPFTRVQCADLLATLGRRFVGDTPWSQELDGPRVRSILTLAGVTGGSVDPGTVALLPRDVDRQPAADLAREVAAQAGGILFITMADAPAYHDAEHRRANQASLTLDACQLAMSPTWTRDMQGLVNEVAVTYGVAPEGSEQPVYTASNPDSQSRYGRLAYSASSQLATVDDATTRGQALLTRNAYPVWDLGQLEVVLATLSAAAFDTLMQLELGALLGLTGLPLGTPQTSTAAWVEGWEEHLTADEHQLTLMVSGYCRTAPFLRWDDTAPSLTWDAVASSLRWDQAYCLGPAVSFGRWNDVPGNLFWDDLAATVTWDTWAY